MKRWNLTQVYVDKQIKNKLKAEAAAAGMSLQDYLAFKLSKDSKDKPRYKVGF